MTNFNVTFNVTRLSQVNLIYYFLRYPFKAQAQQYKFIQNQNNQPK